MTVATLQMVLLVGGCHSDHEKKKRMRAIMAKLHRHFNVSVAEVDRDHDPAEARLVVAAVGRTRREVRATLERVADAVAVHPRAELVSQTITEV
jgi:uncharacterized protein YlxP (DUF503 family)